MSNLDELENEKLTILRSSKLVDGSVDETRALVREALERRRQGITYNLARTFYHFLKENVPRVSEEAQSEESDWEQIESLSQLRAVVGGRFKNLKEKWIGAGFPLRQHRGDRQLEAELSESGWLELSVWINKQGFNARLAQPEQPWLFEVRKLSEE